MGRQGGGRIVRMVNNRMIRSRPLLFLAILGVTATLTGLLAPNAFAVDASSLQWYLAPMKSAAIWQVAAGQGITVAVIDSGVQTPDPDLSGRLLPGVNFGSADRADTSDRDGHGTEMAELIAGAGVDGGIQGLAPKAKLLILKYGGKIGFGVIDAIRYAAQHGARIINMSLGSPGTESPDLQSAVDYAHSKGVLMFAATGNDGDKENSALMPSIMPGVVGVGAVNKDLTAAKWSTHGPQVALSAPGDDIPMRCPKNVGGGAGYCQSGGTSQATAIASASAALIWSAHPSWTANQVLRVMMQTAGKPSDNKVPSEYLGYGIVRPREVLLDHQGDPGPANVYPLPGAPDSASAGSPSTTPSSASDPKGNAHAVSPGEHDGALPWVFGGLGAAVVAVGATVFLTRRRPAY